MHLIFLPDSSKVVIPWILETVASEEGVEDLDEFSSPD